MRARLGCEQRFLGKESAQTMRIRHAEVDRGTRPEIDRCTKASLLLLLCGVQAWRVNHRGCQRQQAAVPSVSLSYDQHTDRLV